MNSTKCYFCSKSWYSFEYCKTMKCLHAPSSSELYLKVWLIPILLSFVYHQVFVEISLAGCLKWTMGTDIWFLPCMSANMSLQNVPVGGTVRAVWASKRPLPSVCINVFLKEGVPGSSIQTIGAKVRLGPGVGKSYVFPDFIHASSGVVTMWTLMA